LTSGYSGTSDNGRYEQWNIDPASVVSFAALAFGRGDAPPPGEGGA